MIEHNICVVRVLHFLSFTPTRSESDFELREARLAAATRSVQASQVPVFLGWSDMCDAIKLHPFCFEHYTSEP